ncbi:hypothetical protein BCEP4_1310031 [Burkholderia cepacia]|nr:hypothetical protein BCEP4_1310031 [Burkholderia cepacia]
MIFVPQDAGPRKWDRPFVEMNLRSIDLTNKWL